MSILAAQHLHDRFRLRSGDRKNLHREHDGIAPRIVVEHDLDRRVGIEAAVPIGIAVDADRREARRQRAGGEHMVERDRHVAAVEIMHLAGAHIDGADGQPRLLGVEAIEVDQVAERLAQIVDGVEGRAARRRPAR